MRDGYCDRVYARYAMHPYAVSASMRSADRAAFAEQVVERGSRRARHDGKSRRKDMFARLFAVILTDNGTEFADTESLERSMSDDGSARCKVYYCDVRQPQQKAGCERNHVELRKLLPKGGGISFDDLDGRDMKFVMSQLNSEPRGKYAELSPIKLMKAVMPDDAKTLLDALGIEGISHGDLNLTVGAINEYRKKRGMSGLI